MTFKDLVKLEEVVDFERGFLVFGEGYRDMPEVSRSHVC